MTTDPDEFAHLRDEAAALGLPEPMPKVTREHLDGGLSALRWGDAPEAVLLHGAGLNAHTWDGTLLALGADATALDLPGHGDSAWREDGDYRPRTNADAIAPVLDALTWDVSGAHSAGAGLPIVLVGHSLGGATAIAVAAQRRDLVRALVLVDFSPGIRPADASQVREFLAGARSFASRDEIVDRAIASGIGSDRAALERGVRLNTRVRDDGSVVFKHHLVALPDDAPDMSAEFADLWSDLASIDVPVLLVRATHGFIDADGLAEFRDRVPAATVVELESGHNVQEQRPVELADALRAFDPRLGAGAA